MDLRPSNRHAHHQRLRQDFWFSWAMFYTRPWATLYTPFLLEAAPIWDGQDNAYAQWHSPKSGETPSMSFSLWVNRRHRQPSFFPEAEIINYTQHCLLLALTFFLTRLFSTSPCSGRGWAGRITCVSRGYWKWLKEMTFKANLTMMHFIFHRCGSRSSDERQLAGSAGLNPVTFANMWSSHKSIYIS